MRRVIVSTAGVHIQQYLLHREFWITTIIGKMLPVLVPLFVWIAIFQYTGKDTLEGWSRDELISYYLLIFAFVMFTQIYFHRDMSRMVHEGKLNEWLLRPLSIFEMAAGMVLARIFVLLIPSLLALLLGYAFIPSISNVISFYGILYAVILLPFSIVLLSILSVMIGMFAFWLTQTEGTFALIMMVFEFFGGAILPLALLPGFLQELSNFLPLKYAIYLPAEKILFIDSGSLLHILAGQIAWIIILLFLTTILLSRGLRRYDAVGG